MQDKRVVLQGELYKVQTRIIELEKALREKPDFGMSKGHAGASYRKVDRVLPGHLKPRAKSLEQALSRLRQGCYGICIRCGRPIRAERLAVLPDAKTCIRCARSVRMKRERR